MKNGFSKLFSLQDDQVRRFLIVKVLVCLMSSHAYAVVVYDSTGNTTAPEDDPGFANIAIVNGDSAIYLGNRWMLTALHVNAGAAEFPGLGTFSYDSQSIVRIQNPQGEGLSTDTDLVAYRLKDEPGLPTLSITTEIPPIGSEVLMIGNGRDRLEEEFFWDAELVDGEWVWIEVEPPGEYSGYKTTTTNTIRWGKNIVEDDEPLLFEFDDGHDSVIATRWGDVVALVTEFDHPNDENPVSALATDSEAHAAVNDSGGAVFYKDGDKWLLAGVMNAVLGYTNGQPQWNRTPVFGNMTFSADLSVYRDQIVALYWAGDFDGDELFTSADIDLLSDEILAPTNNLDFDLNGDDIVNFDDHLFWVAQIAETFAGDSNLDGEFNSNDLIKIFQAGVYEDDIPLNADWSTGDWNGDREFDTSDLIFAFQQGGYEAGPRAVSVVPEPSNSSLLTVVVFIFAIWPWRTGGQNKST